MKSIIREIILFSLLFIVIGAVSGFITVRFNDRDYKAELNEANRTIQELRATVAAYQNEVEL